MFQNIAFRPVRVNNPNPRNHTCPTRRPLVQSDDLAEIATVTAYWTKRALIGGTIVYTVVKTVDTASKVALIIATNNLK